MFTTIFRLFQYYLEQNVPELNIVTLYTSQYRNENNSRRFNYPVCFIEIKPMEIKQYSNNKEAAEVQIDLHIISELYTSFDNADSDLIKSLEHLNLVDKIYAQINNIGTHNFPDKLSISRDITIDSIKRIGMSINNEFGILRDTIISYALLASDISLLEIPAVINIDNLDNIKTNIEI